MTSGAIITAVIAGVALRVAPARYAQSAGTVDRVYALDCGELHLEDGGRVSPAMTGKPVDLSSVAARQLEEDRVGAARR